MIDGSEIVFGFCLEGEMANLVVELDFVKN